MRTGSRGRIAACALGAALALACGTSLAYFTALGSGSATAPVSALSAPVIVTATPAVGGSVSVDWDDVTAPAQGSVTYFVTRDGGEPGGTCATPAVPTASTSCVDKEVDAGGHTYIVTAVWRTWEAPSAERSVDVAIGVATHLTIAAATTSPVAGATDNLTISARDSAETVVPTYAGSKSLVFSGASASPSGSVPTVVNSSGTAIAFGAATAIAFTNGVATVASSKNGVMRVYRAGPAAIAAGDGTLSTATPLAINVIPTTLSKLALAPETTTPAVGAADNLTITAQDTYGNTVTGHAGAKSLTFSGGTASPAGNAATVSNSAGEAVAFGTATTIQFSAGVATASGVANGEMRLYKSGAQSIKVTEGAISSATVTVTPGAGAAVKLLLAASATSFAVTASSNLTTTAQDAYGNTATSYTGAKTLTFGGASASPGGNAPTVSNSSGTAIPFGTATAINFTNGVATISSTTNGVMRIYRAGAAAITVSDGTISNAPALSVTVALGALSKFALAPETTTPTVGAADNLTITAQDTYANTITTHAGAKSLTFSGGTASPAGNAATVSNSAGEAVAFGTATTIQFSAGVATASGVANGEMRLYKSGAQSIKVTEGAISSATVTVTPSPGAATKFSLGASTVTPAAGASVSLTTTALDIYGNTATAYTGAKSLVFSGPATSPGGNAPTVVDAAGVAVNVGASTPITFTNGVASVASAKNGVLKPTKAEVAPLAVTDGSISTSSPLNLTVSPTTPNKLVFLGLSASAGTISSPCFATCTVTGLGKSGIVKALVAVADTYGNTVSNIGTGHSIAVTATPGTVTNGALTFPSTGAAVSPSEFTYTAPATGGFGTALKAATSAGTAYTNATATINK